MAAALSAGDLTSVRGKDHAREYRPGSGLLGE